MLSSHQAKRYFVCYFHFFHGCLNYVHILCKSMNIKLLLKKKSVCSSTDLLTCPVSKSSFLLKWFISVHDKKYALSHHCHLFHSAVDTILLNLPEIRRIEAQEQPNYLWPVKPNLVCLHRRKGLNYTWAILYIYWTYTKIFSGIQTCSKY